MRQLDNTEHLHSRGQTEKLFHGWKKATIPSVQEAELDILIFTQMLNMSLEWQSAFKANPQVLVWLMKGNMGAI